LTSLERGTRTSTGAERIDRTARKVLAILVPLLLGMTPIRDRDQRVIGYIGEQRDGRTFVRDCHYRLLGWSDGVATYDANGRRLYQSPVPQLLLDSSPCLRLPETPRPSRPLASSRRSP
jgi:hypothetical protein